MRQGRLERLATIPKLRKAWDRFWRTAKKQKSTGVDGVTPADFQKDTGRNLASVRLSLLDGYEFQLLRANPIPKPSSGQDRIICVPTVRDRLAQRLIGEYLANRQKQLGIANPASFGFVKGNPDSPRGVQAARNRAVELRKDFPYAYKADISRFFDQIPRAKLFSIIEKVVATPSLNDFLWGAINCEIDESDPGILRKVKAAGIEANKGVRQGMPLSPFFANIILRSFDRTLLSKGFNLVRYADDFIILAESEADCLSADELCRELLCELDLGIPYLHEKTKTAICAPNQAIDFLGLALTPKGGEYVLEITDRQIAKIRENLGTLKDIKRLRREKWTVVDVVQRVEARIAGYRSAYPAGLIDNFKLLDDTLRNARSAIMTSLFSTMFGKSAVKELTRWQKEFLLISAITETSDSKS